MPLAGGAQLLDEFRRVGYLEVQAEHADVDEAWSPATRSSPRYRSTGFTNTQATAGRYHYEEAKAGAEPRVNRSRTGVAVFADDFQTIRVFAERDNSNIVHWTEIPEGGHYASMEQPAALAADLREFFAPAPRP